MSANGRILGTLSVHVTRNNELKEQNIKNRKEFQREYLSMKAVLANRSQQLPGIF